MARQLSPLEGCGPGTIEKVDKFLRENPNAAGGLAAAGVVDEDAFIKDLEREIVVSMLASGDLTLARVQKQRDDVKEGDF